MIRKLASIFGEAVILGLLLAALAAIPAVRSQFAQNNYAGVSTGTANAQVITLPNIASYDDVLNQEIVFTVGTGLNNTAPTTLNVSSLGVRNLYRTIPAGLGALGGGELVAGQRARVMWDGTQFQIMNSANPFLPGFMADYAGSAGCPTGYFASTSQTLAQATYPTLFGILGTSWGSPGGGNFSTPDLRGRTTYGIDASVGGFANRITVAGGNFNSQTFAAAGGQQLWTLDLTQIPSFNPANSITPFTPSVASAGPGSLTGLSAPVLAPGVGQSPNTGGGFAAQQVSVAISGAPFIAMGLVTLSGSSIGGGGSHPVLSPGATLNKCVRA